MKQESRLEKELFSSYWNDGIGDILFGFAVLIAGAGWDIVGPLSVIQIPLWISLWLPLRRNLVEPYEGFVRFSIEREHANEGKLKTILVFGLGALALMLMAVLFYSNITTIDNLEIWIGALPSGLIALAMVLAYGLLRVTRLFLYAAAFLSAGAASAIFNQGPGIALGIGSIVPLLQGFFLWYCFRKDSRNFSTHQ